MAPGSQTKSLPTDATKASSQASWLDPKEGRSDAIVDRLRFEPPTDWQPGGLWATGIGEKRPGPACNSLATVRKLFHPVSNACLVVLTLLTVSYSLFFVNRFGIGFVVGWKLKPW